MSRNAADEQAQLRRREAAVHADALAPSAGTGRTFGPERGSQRLWPSLRSSYLFAEEWLLRRDLAGKRVLDYGCGQGTFATFLAGLSRESGGPTLVGIDISPRALATARELAIEHGVARQSLFAVADCERLPFPDGHFDIVFSAGTMSCLNLRQAFRELSRVVAKDGHVVIVDTLGYNPLSNIVRRIKLRAGLKVQWSVDHILKTADIAESHRWFDRVDAHYFDLTTLVLTPLRYRFARPVAMFTNLLNHVDRFMLRGPLRPLAFKFVLVCSQPHPERSDEMSYERAGNGFGRRD